jgi:hypothetical protein
MINNQNINLTNLSSNKRVIPNNLLNINEQADRETMLAERPFHAYEINSSAYTDEKGITEPDIPVEINYESDWLLKMQETMFDYKKLNQTTNEILCQQSMMNNNNEKQNIYTINNDNFSLENNNTSKNENKILNNKKGRKKLNEISNTKRNKFAKDNINKKIKIFFLHCFLSELIQTISKTIIKIKKFNKKIISQTNIIFNIDLFNLTLRELLKTKISKKYKIIQTRPNENVCSPNENEKILNLIEQINDFKILLDMKLKEIYKIFIKNKEEFIKIMKSKFNIYFKNNFEYYVNSEKDQKYREKLLYYGNNYENEYLNEKEARKLRKRKNLIDE